MKIFLKICLLVIYALAIAAPPLAMGADDAAWQKVLAAARKEGELVCFTDLFEGDFGVQVSKLFKEKYGITLEFMGGSGAARIEKIKMEQRTKGYVSDAIDGGGFVLYSLRDNGYLDSVIADIPALKEKDKFAIPPIVDPKAQMLPVMTRHSGFWYNPNLVKPEDVPKSFNDLLDPKWKGKIYLTNPLYQSGPDTLLVVFGKDKVLTEDYFKKLYAMHKDTLTGPSGGSNVILDKLIRGEFAIAGPVGGGSSFPLALAGAPIKPLDLKEGTLYGTMKWGALKNSPHPNATKVFINWLLSREGQLVVSKGYGSDGIRNDVPSSLPFSFKAGPIRVSTMEMEILAEEHFSSQYLAKLVGIRK